MIKCLTVPTDAVQDVMPAKSWFSPFHHSSWVRTCPHHVFLQVCQLSFTFAKYGGQLVG